MDVFRKVPPVAAMTLAVIGLIVCVVGGIAAWALNAPAKQITVGALSAIEMYSALGSQTAQTIGSSVGDVKTATDQVNQMLAGATDSNRARFVESIQARLNETVTLQLERVINTARSIEQTAVNINQTLESVNRLPGINVPTFGDELRIVGARLSDAAAAVKSIRAALAEVNLDLARVQAAIAEATIQLGAAEASLAGAQARFQAVSAASADVKSRIPGWFDRISLMATALFILFGAGQVFLFKAGLDRFRQA